MLVFRQGCVAALLSFLLALTVVDPSKAQTIGEIAGANPNFSILVSLATKAGLDQLLVSTDDGPITVFAPTNDAFTTGTVSMLEDDGAMDYLKAFIKHHVVKGKVLSSDLTDGLIVQSEADIFLNFQVSPTTGAVKVYDSNVVQADLEASNGVIHVIDAPLFPIALGQALGGLPTLKNALTMAGLLDLLNTPGPFTLFAPAEEAWAGVREDLRKNIFKPEWYKHLQAVLLYHVVNSDVKSGNLTLEPLPSAWGETLEVTSLDPPVVSGANVVLPDLSVSNGVMHVVDKVLLPSVVTLNILQLGQNDPQFSTLVGLGESVGIDDIVSADGPVTLFAPTNAAFEKLEEENPGTLAFLSNETNKDALIAILKYHIVDDIVITEQSDDGEAFKTLDSDDKIILSKTSVEGAVKLMANDANIADPDVPALNGVVQVVDRVLVKPINTLVDVAAAEGLTSLLDFAVQAELDAILQHRGPFTVFGPTNQAFADAPIPGKFLTEEYMPHLKALLLNHVAEGGVLSSDLSADQEVPTLYDEVTVTSVNPTVMINNDTTVTKANVNASNGILHVVDKVLIPDTMTQVVYDPDEPLFSILSRLVQLAGLEETLSGEGPFTVLAPPDSAFTNETVTFLEDPENLDYMRAFVLNHAIPGIKLAEELAVTPYLTSSADVLLSFTADDEGVKVYDASPIVDDDNLVSNGVVHVIDGLLFPITAGDLPRGLPAMYGLLEQTGLDKVLRDRDDTFTVFAPTNEAFEKLPAYFLKYSDPKWGFHAKALASYHIVPQKVLFQDLILGDAFATLLPDQEVYVGKQGPTKINENAIVIEHDLMGINGVMHVLDTVLLPESITSNILQIGSSIPEFSTLVMLVEKAGLAEALSGEGPLTLFAPDNAAFDALEASSPGILDLLSQNVDVLAEILTYHVVPGNYPAEELTNGLEIPSLSNDEVVTISVNGGDDSIMVDDSGVTSADAIARNGIIHVINSVLLPPTVNVGALTLGPTATPIASSTSPPTSEPTMVDVSTDSPTSTPTEEDATSSAPRNQFVGLLGLTVGLGFLVL